MTATPAEVLETARRRSGMSLHQLWLSQALLGGAASPDEVRSFLSGQATPTAHQYDVLAHALNESFLERGLDHLVPYADER